ncbi:AAA family ATPase [Ruminococcus bicirculans (ex Wegman et al. 2014)]|jgi:5-methylcytosine-specific restriction protein B|uniref:AAA family ATPase n=1 Tax=Ruminococcus bicirculans (ex Wegman et al. 2014) TaxID=1160721 RepID=UPI0016495A66|nr:AAA family ATPase [Ruminococcus bicirculans (ex Wegman et al. 2014)]MBC3514727.1 EVE domain-containing protein [Ruminococcus bicirculans (ex Wegman et al. 2014)]
MFDQFRLKDVLAQYKQSFVSTQWGNEKYKWEAVKWFQDNWDVNASDFPEMLSRSLDKTFNLLASNNNFPKGMIVGFAKAAPEEVRAMFIALFDESQDVFERMNAFKMQSSILLEKYGNGAAQHYQYENAISTYLWLRYPDKYYIYKFGEVKTVSSELESDYRFKKGAYADNIRNFLRLYDEISAALKEDTELVNLFQSQLTDTCYPDPELKTLTIDVGFYISRLYSQENAEKAEAAAWFPSDYTPGLTEEDWLALLGDDKVFTTGSLEIMKRMKDYGGQATCTQLAVKYGETKNFYLTGSTALAKRVVEKTGCPVLTDDKNENSKWWPVLYIGRYATKDEQGSYIWKLRDELSAALDKTDLSGIELYVAAAPGEEDRGYWWLNANPKIWSYSDIAVGEVQSYTLYNENGNKRRIFQNFLDAKAGDMIIGYESNPVKQIVAIGRVSAEQDGEKLFFEKVEGLTSPIDYATLKECPELERMEYFQNPQGSLFKLTRGEYDFILDMIREENPVSTDAAIDAYTKSDFLDEVYMTEKRYENLVAVLRNKKNIILQGAPGVGKTFAARRLAWSMMGEQDDSRIEFVQFHQNYSYEDFMMGYKPVEDGFELKYGIFYRFCQKAANQPDKEFFFIIDEINRGNMSKIFGELLMLIEKDYRGTKATLAYNGLSFSVPKNLYIIGMMNTADRSLAMIDYALRRRFSFFEVEPGFDSEGFIHYQNGLNNETLNELISKVKDLNHEIALDKSLGKGFCIGHSYFCGRDICTDEWMHSIVDYDILPMLSEYWFDDPNKLQRWENILQGVFQ